jgi:hypothetical protein
MMAGLKERLSITENAIEAALEARFRDVPGQWPDGFTEGGARIERMLAERMIEAALQALTGNIEALEAALRPFAEYASRDGFGLDNNGQEVPASEGVGWIYLTVGDFRRARQALGENSHG